MVYVFFFDICYCSFAVDSNVCLCVCVSMLGACGRPLNSIRTSVPTVELADNLTTVFFTVWTLSFFSAAGVGANLLKTDDAYFYLGASVCI